MEKNQLPQTSSVSSRACPIQKDYKDTADSGISVEETQRTIHIDHPRSTTLLKRTQLSSWKADRAGCHFPACAVSLVLQAGELRRMFIEERACLNNTAARMKGKKGRSISSTEDETDFSLTEEVPND